MSRFVFFFQAEDGIRDATVTGVQTCALPISALLATIRCCETELQVAGAWPTDTRPLHHMELGALLTVARDAGWLVPTLPHTSDAVESQIGRASCRERV